MEKISEDEEGTDNPGFSPSPSGSKAGSLLDVAQHLSAAANPLKPEGAPAARRSSVADVALALTRARSSPRGSRVAVASFLLAGLDNKHELLKELDRSKYTHPFGNSTNILEELIYGDQAERETEEIFTEKSSSSMKLIGWLVGVGFFIMMTGAIIFGAEMPIECSKVVIGWVLLTILSLGALSKMTDKEHDD